MTKRRPTTEPTSEKSQGCENCSNTGFQPGVALSEAGLCPVCSGSPFEPRNKK